jgi:hypothetical protein
VVVEDVVVGGVVEYQSCRPLNFLITAKICKDLKVLGIPELMKNLHIADGSNDPQYPKRFWC